MNNFNTNNMIIADILIDIYLDYINNFNGDITLFSKEYDFSEQIANVYINTGRELHNIKKNKNDK